MSADFSKLMDEFLKQQHKCVQLEAQNAVLENEKKHLSEKVAELQEKIDNLLKKQEQDRLDYLYGH